MDAEQLKNMRERYEAQIRHAEEMIAYIDEYRFVIRDIDDTRPDQELIDEQKQLHLRLISNYSTYLAALEKRYGA
ncbi:hypothetical protein ELH06_08465 [Rhizobium ruizarguesonis]|uniref:hypothetical protein n=1 Tax=Rhizobium ruizarguesonis TaxID=2081791 RepID=UPI001030E3E3|nr:hypothetical protein [Rhizobium ruizarguesonis]TBE49191.1 hypothetical protein ELH06_08465 [Rhizobium ruizarguesonis]